MSIITIQKFGTITMGDDGILRIHGFEFELPPEQLESRTCTDLHVFNAIIDLLIDWRDNAAPNPITATARESQ